MFIFVVVNAEMQNGFYLRKKIIIGKLLMNIYYLLYNIFNGAVLIFIVLDSSKCFIKFLIYYIDENDTCEQGDNYLKEYICGF